MKNLDLFVSVQEGNLNINITSPRAITLNFLELTPENAKLAKSILDSMGTVERCLCSSTVDFPKEEGAKFTTEQIHAFMAQILPAEAY